MIQTIFNPDNPGNRCHSRGEVELGSNHLELLVLGRNHQHCPAFDDSLVVAAGLGLPGTRPVDERHPMYHDHLDLDLFEISLETSTR